MTEDIKNTALNEDRDETSSGKAMSETPGTLAGKLLLAMPNMTDTRFERAVIFMCAHDEQGAMGLVINNVLADIDFNHILESVDLKSDIIVDLQTSNMAVLNGGPVDTQRGFMLHTNDFSHNETIIINNEFHVTGTVEALEAVAKGEGPEHMLFALGYAGWQAGQLEDELKQNAWILSEPDPKLLFSTNPDKKWHNAVQKLGFDPAMLSTEMGRA